MQVVFPSLNNVFFPFSVALDDGQCFRDGVEIFGRQGAVMVQI
jgi:hypothetical protein